MTSASESAVDIDPVRPYLQSVQRLLQQDRYMIRIIVCPYHRESPPGFMTCLARLLNASGEKDSKN